MEEEDEDIEIPETVMIKAADILSLDLRHDDRRLIIKNDVQPVLFMGSDGRLHRRISPILDHAEVNGTAGNLAHAIGNAGEIWEIRSISITSVAGADYSIEDATVRVSADVTIGAGATDELITVPIPVAGDNAITINNGAAGDTWNIRAVRLL